MSRAPVAWARHAGGEGKTVTALFLDDVGYGARQGDSFVEGASHEHPFRIEGWRDGVDLAIETTRRSGSSRVPVTCLSARASVPAGIRLVAALGEGRRGEADGG
jgi:hypothetical protein